MTSRRARRIARELLTAAAAITLAACSTSRSSEPRISYVGILQLQSPDPQRLARWYQDNLGFPRPSDLDGGVLKGEMQTSWGPLVYRIEPIPQGAKPRAVDLSFFVNHLEPFVERLTRAGSPPLRRDDTIEGKSAWFRDPDGNNLQLTER